MISAAYDDWVATHDRLSAAEARLYRNRHLGGLIAYRALAERFAPDTLADVDARITALRETLVGEFYEGAGNVQFKAVHNSAELDRFIGGGNALFDKVRPHRATIAKLNDLTPVVGEILRESAFPAAKTYMDVIDTVMPGWWLVGEERQVHFGENFMDFPHVSRNLFLAKAYAMGFRAAALEPYVDIPYCEGDLYYIEKIVAMLEAW
ncbi:MAG: hypothetical protein O3A46_06030 [Candidatus Poribacteria bacterium]|nr:hypothetical protein [Candidatus Poribacteria bacterium]